MRFRKVRLRGDRSGAERPILLGVPMEKFREVVVYEHELYGHVRVGLCWWWVRIGDTWRIDWNVEAVEFDLFTPPDEMRQMEADVRATNWENELKRRVRATSGGR